jgi:hypothetical protein
MPNATATKTTTTQAPLPKTKTRGSYDPDSKRQSFRTDGNLTEKERQLFDVMFARNWEAVTTVELADSSDLNVNQVNGAISVLLAKDYIVSERRTPPAGGKAQRFIEATKAGKSAHGRPLDFVDPQTKEKIAKREQREADAKAKSAKAKAEAKAETKAKTPKAKDA